MVSEKRLSLILSQPEGQFTEFKRSVSASLNREIVAFANSGGGYILVGVDNSGKIVGVPDINDQISRIESIARNCDPPTHLKIEAQRVEGREILAVEVPDGADKPHSCSSGFYLRSGASTQKMTRDEIVEFLYSAGQVKYEEKLCRDFRYPEDFDDETFRRFLAMANISMDSLSQEDVLVNLGVAVVKDPGLVFNNAGVLFFAKEPTRFLRHAVVDCILFQGTEKLDVLDRKELRGNLIENVRQAMIFLKRHLSLRYEIKGLQRKEILELPEDALREAVLNAVMHRDYHFDTANISVEIFRDRVEISDPGGLPPGMRPGDLGKKSVRRNKLIADMFHRVGEVEKIGSGINRIRGLMASEGLGEPRFELTSFFTLTFDRIVQVTTEVTPHVTTEVRRVYEGVDEGVGEGVDEGVKWRLSKEIIKIHDSKSLTRKEIEKFFDISTATAERDLSLLKGAGFARFVGPPKTGRYVLTERGRKLREEKG